MEVTAGNDGALAAGIALAATMQSFVCTHETSHVGTNMAHRVLNSSTQENVHLTITTRAAGRDWITVVGLTWVCLQLNCCCNSQSSCYTYSRWFSSRPRSPVKHSVLCKYKHVYYVTNCSTEVGEHPILFFLFFVEESSKRAAKTIACPCRKHVGGYTAGVCLNTNITHAPQRVARSRIFLSLFLQPIISYRVRLHDDFIWFSVSRVP